MELEFTPTLADYRELVRANLVRRPLGVILLATALCAPLPVFWWQTNLPWFVGGVWALFVLFMLLSMPHRLASQLVRRSPHLVQPHRIRTDSSGYELHSPGYDVSLHWAAFRELKSTNHLWLLFRESEVFVVPKRAFASSEAEQGWVRAVRSFMAAPAEAAPEVADLSFCLSRADYTEIYREAQPPQLKFMRWFLTLPVAIGVVANARFIQVGHHLAWMISLPFTLLFVVAIALMTPWVQARLLRAEAFRPVSYRILPEGFLHRHSQGETLYGWSTLQGIEQSQSLWLVRTDSVVLPVPRRAFANLDEESDWIDLVRGNLQSSRR
ncbi:MAG: YcxB family protein [Myxococcales bacterium]|nr:YcxB family protein [Myxococcales bacterium]